MRYQPGLFGHLPEWETSDHEKAPGTGLSDLSLSVLMIGDRVDVRPTRFPGATRRRKRRSR
jgi:hypothetical protein